MNMTSEDAAKLRGKKSVEFILASPNEETWAVDKIRSYRELLMVRVAECDAIMEKATPIAVNH